MKPPAGGRLRPTPRLAFLAIGGILPLALLPIAPWILSAVFLYDLLLLLLAVVEAGRMPRSFDEIRRIVPSHAYQGETTRAGFEIRGAGEGTIRVVIRDDMGPGFAPLAVRAHTVQGGFEIREVVALLPIARGVQSLGPIEIEWTGPWGLGSRRGRPALADDSARTIRVFPARDLETRARGRSGVTPVGALLAHRASEGHEFDAFRAYVLGDDFRRIDWKASARRGALHIRTYRPERGQNIVCVLDTGRGGAFAVADGVTLLDRAAAASAAIVRAARVEGDRVGILAYDAVVRGWLPPGAGTDHHRAALRLLSDLETFRAEGDPLAALAMLARRLPRRSLVLVFTEASDPESAEPLRAAMRRLVPKHLPVLVTITDPALDRAATAPPDGEATRGGAAGGEATAFRRLAALDLLDERRKSFARLRAVGCEAIAVRSDRLPRATVGAYLDLKGRGRL